MGRHGYLRLWRLGLAIDPELQHALEVAKQGVIADHGCVRCHLHVLPYLSVDVSCFISLLEVRQIKIDVGEVLPVRTVSLTQLDRDEKPLLLQDL